MDPWQDYLAIPVAPLLLGVQLAVLFARSRMIRLGLSFACAIAIAVMLAYVSSLPTRPDEGVNIGAGVLVLWFLFSLLLLAVAVAREALSLLAKRP